MGNSTPYSLQDVEHKHPNLAPLCGVVLAGGASSRLGQDKAMLRLSSGETVNLLERTVGLLAEVTERVVVVGREHPDYTCVPDCIPGRGPVGGIASALQHLEGCACLVLSCDLPFMDTTHLKRLINARKQAGKPVLATAYCQKDTGYVESLVAIYEPESLPYFMHCTQEQKLKVSQVVPVEAQCLVSYSTEESLPFFNINYPADLELVRRMLWEIGRQ